MSWRWRKFAMNQALLESGRGGPGGARARFGDAALPMPLRGAGDFDLDETPGQGARLNSAARAAKRHGAVSVRAGQRVFARTALIHKRADTAAQSLGKRRLYQLAGQRVEPNGALAHGGAGRRAPSRAARRTERAWRIARAVDHLGPDGFERGQCRREVFLRFAGESHDHVRGER